MLEVKKRYPTKMREYTGAYEVPEQLRPIVDDLVGLLNRVLNSKKTSMISADISLNTFDDWSKFNLEFLARLDRNKPCPEEEQEFINNIIDSTILEIARLDRSAVLTFTLHQDFQKTIRNYKLLFESSSEDDPFKE